MLLRGGPGIMSRAASLPLRPSRLSAFLSTKLVQATDRFFSRLPLQADRYDGKFVLGVGSMLVFTAVSFWSLTRYWDVNWYAGEDGVSEWWSVATYLASAAMATLTARLLTRLGHPRLGWVHLLLAVLFLFGALEEVSWGQRLFGWSTPETLTSINEQDETTIHNIPSFRTVFYTTFFWAGLVALVWAVIRALLHHHRRVTTADFILPSLVLSPALLMIMIWVTGGYSLPGELPDFNPVGSEVPKVLLGLCLCLYTYANLKRAVALRSRKIVDQASRPG